MITEQDLQEAIAECQGTRNPNANTCIKLAAYYTILNQMSGEPSKNFDATGYSYDSGVSDDVIRYEGTSDFSQVINGRKVSDIIPVLDELMDTIKIVNPPLYNGVMRKLY